MCYGSEARLRDTVRSFGHPERLRVWKGWFEDTFPAAVREGKSVAILHCDSDLYASVRLTLDTFYDKVAPGGYIIIDDYGDWVGARRATDEFRAMHSLVEPLAAIDRFAHYWQKS
jgi:hypothetical protein